MGLGRSKENRSTSHLVTWIAAGLAIANAWTWLPGRANGQTSAPSVIVTSEQIIIPTYEVGDPERNPIFYTQESYQGAQKRVYPYPLQDHLTHNRVNKTYTSLRLENPYVSLSVLPELGGRLFSATDKTNGYDFFYRQHVIKPALIGMLGAWISGGVEWCAFHHHRNSTFMPVDHEFRENPDGSATIWFGETERRHRMRWLIGLTLFPDKSYVEATVKFFNRTAEPHSILYWANVAVHVNDSYQVIFPPSVQVATYHSKIDFTHWPLARGIYRGHDYTGVDVSYWKNSPVSNSFFAWDLQEDFMGGYDHSRQAGVVHVADHHVVCGAKLWEWGTGPYGRAWDEILTDEDGPYAELMVGAFSDNQPDYSWIKPYEVKTFKQYWYPVRGIGGFKNANLAGAVNLEVQHADTALVAFHTTSRHENATAILQCGDRRLLEETITIAPDQPCRRSVSLPGGVQRTELRASLLDADGRELIAYQPIELPEVDKLPARVTPPPKPQDIKTADELYLTGLRIEQIHNPTVDPADYYREAIRRDPGDARANTMLGVHFNKRFMYSEAEKHLRSAIDRLSTGYTRPMDTEALFQLGVALRGQRRDREAYDAFNRASWDHAQHAAACFQLAQLSCKEGAYTRALEQLERSLSTNALNTKALHLKTAVLRRMGREEQDLVIGRVVMDIDPLDLGTRVEVLGHMPSPERRNVHEYLELACDYHEAGLWDEAIGVLELAAKDVDSASTYPMVHYLLGLLYAERGDKERTAASFARAASMSTDYCFPFRSEERTALLEATRRNPQDARAYYYLGNLLYDFQPDAAMAAWEQSRAIDSSLSTVHRNLGWAHYRHKNDVAQAIACYERAVACESLEPRLFLELDTLYQFGNVSAQRRLAALERHHAIVAQRQDSLLREIMVLVLTGKHDQAIEYLSNNRFHAREGSEGIHDVYADAHLLHGSDLLKAGQVDEALSHFRKAAEYPGNLGVGKPQSDPRTAQIQYFIGVAHESRGDKAEARKAFECAVQQDPGSESLEARLYQALAHGQLGQKPQADAIMDEVIRGGQRRLEEDKSANFFAKFGEQETARTRAAAAHYLLALGYYGKGDSDRARQEIVQAVKLDLSHVWARHWQTRIDPQAKP